MGLRVGKKLVFKEHAHSARRALRLQRYGTVSLIGKGIHFLLHNVRSVANAAGKKLRMLQHRRAGFAVAEFRASAAHKLFDILPFVAFLRGNVLHALRRLNLHNTPLSYFPYKNRVLHP